MARKTDRERFVDSITVQPSECEEYALVPTRLIASMRAEIVSLRAQLGQSAPPKAKGEADEQ